MSDDRAKPRRVALVTGATGGLGKEIVRRLAADNHAVGILGGTDSTALDATRSELEGSGVPVHGGLVDLADPSECAAAAQRAKDALGPIDILINCAAVRRPEHYLSLSAEQWQHTLSANVVAPFVLAQDVIPNMVAGGFGRIVNISGLGAIWSSPTSIHIDVSKGALDSLTRALASSLARTGITVNSALMGFLDEGQRRADPRGRQVPMGRAPTTEEAVSAVLFLVSEHASYITGETIHVTGGGPGILMPDAPSP